MLCWEVSLSHFVLRVSHLFTEHCVTENKALDRSSRHENSLYL